MKIIFFTIFFLLNFINLFAEEKILVGKLVQSGKMLITSDKSYTLKTNELTYELSEEVEKNIRVLCKIESDTCEPIRYEFEPFEFEQNIPAWTIKKIPKYIYQGNYSFNPTVSPDGNYMFWSALIKTENSSTQKIWFSERDNYGFFKKGVQIVEPLNNQQPSAVISIMPGGNELFIFGSYYDQELDKLENYVIEEQKRLTNTIQNKTELTNKINALKVYYKKETEKIFSRIPLYKSHKEEKSWSYPENINFPSFYNLYRDARYKQKEIFGGSTLSVSGRTLIYSAKHEDSKGKLDLYVSLQNQSSSEFPLGKNLGNFINSSEEEMAPFLASDDRTLYFSSNSTGLLTIYYTQRMDDTWTKWTTPRELTENLRGVNFFTIPAQSHWAYISRDGVLEMTYLSEEARPFPIVMINGKVVDKNGKPLSANIHYESLNTQSKKGSTKSNPIDGKFTIVLPYDDNYGFYADKDGYLPSSKNIDLKHEKNINQIQSIELVLSAIKKGESFLINNLFFETKSTEINPQSKPELNRIGTILKEKNTLIVLIEGHTDDVGNEADNLKLSENRAKAVAKYLIENFQISQERIKTIGYGEKQPITNNKSEISKGKNRRVVLKILE